MKSFLSNLREALLDQRRIPALFVIATFVTGLAVDDAASWWARRTTLPEGVLALGVMVLLIAILQTPWFLRYWRGSTPPASVIPARSCRGLVLLASPGGGIVTAEKAIKNHATTLERVWVVHSDLSRESAEGLVERFEQQPRFERVSFAPLVHLTDLEFEDPERVRAAIEANVYAALPTDFRDDDVAIDITGGTKATTAGAFLAGLPEGRRLQVNRAERKDAEGKGTIPGESFEILLSYKIKRVPS